MSDLHSLGSCPPLPCAGGPAHPAHGVTTRVMGTQNICDSVGTHTEALVIIHLVGGIRSERSLYFAFVLFCFY